MSAGGDFGGFSLLELFKLEAEAHCAALGDGLLALEKGPADRAIIEPLMRAAHSIKGAARIVGLDAIVSLAHAMEERFLAARDGREALTPARVDQLLEGVDVLGEIRTLAEGDLAAWTQTRSAQIAQLVERLAAPPPAERATGAVSEAEPAPVAAPVPTSTVETAPVPAAASPAGGAAAPGAVRVAADVMNRMLFLAGEATVEASRLQALIREERAVRFDDGSRRIEELSGALYTEVLRSRMRPFAEGVTAFPRMVRDISRQLGKNVDLDIQGEKVEVDRDILQKLESPLTHMIRNSLDHGIEAPSVREAAGKPARAKVTLVARHQSGMLVIEVRDDGRGIDPEAIRRTVAERRLVDEATAARLTRAELMEFPFLPGFSTKSAVSELSGRGVGLDVVRSMVQDVSGTVTLDSEPGRGARFIMRLPVTRSVIRAALVRIGDGLFAMPLARLERIVLLPEADAQPVQGRLQFTLDERSVGLVHAARVLGGERDASVSGGDADRLAIIVIGSGDARCGLIVDQVCGEEDLVVRPLDGRLGAVPHIAAVAIRSDGEPVFVVDIDDLRRSVEHSLQGGRIHGVSTLHPSAQQRGRRRILVVDDSITVREVERQLLLRRGYDVDVAVDGREGFSALRAGHYDLLVTDVDMPRMTGIELIRAVRREAKYADLPIIIVSYKDREEDRMMGLEAGASAYLTKSSFQDESLIRMVEDLIGAPS